MRDWPWFLIILGAVAVGLLVPLPFDGWLNTVLFWGGVVGALAYAVYVSRSARGS